MKVICFSGLFVDPNYLNSSVSSDEKRTIIKTTPGGRNSIKKESKRTQEHTKGIPRDNVEHRGQDRLLD